MIFLTVRDYYYKSLNLSFGSWYEVQIQHSVDLTSMNQTFHSAMFGVLLF